MNFRFSNVFQRVASIRGLRVDDQEKSISVREDYFSWPLDRREGCIDHRLDFCIRFEEVVAQQERRVEPRRIRGAWDL